MVTLVTAVVLLGVTGASQAAGCPSFVARVSLTQIVQYEHVAVRNVTCARARRILDVQAAAQRFWHVPQWRTGGWVWRVIGYDEAVSRIRGVNGRRVIFATVI